MVERSVDEALELLGRAFPPGPFLDRRLGRALTFQALYEMDLGHHAPGDVLDRIGASLADATLVCPFPPEAVKDARQYAHALIEGVLGNRVAIDAVIQQ